MSNDSTLYQYCFELRSRGIDADVAPPGCPAATYQYPGGRYILGLLDVVTGPVRWTALQYFSETWVVPDPRAANPALVEFEIGTEHEKSSPFFGRPVSVFWKGNDAGTNVLAHLNAAPELAQALLHAPDCVIRACPRYGCWLLTHDVPYTSHTDTFANWESTRRLRVSTFPSRQEWDAYQAIARFLLDADIARPNIPGPDANIAGSYIPGPDWEACQITYERWNETIFRQRARFVAIAGRRGKPSIIAASDIAFGLVPLLGVPMPNGDHKAAHQEVVEKLLADGWLPREVLPPMAQRGQTYWDINRQQPRDWWDEEYTRPPRP